ncbi:DNA polymerase III subunit theta [Escherichia coli]
MAAAGVAFKERYNTPVIAGSGPNVNSLNICAAGFRERLIADRLASVYLSRLPYEPKLK